MRNRRLVTAIMASILLVGYGCGKGAAPTISDLTLAALTVAPGGQLSGQLRVADPDGLGGLKLGLKISAAGVSQPEQAIAVANASDSMTEALVPITLAIAAAAPIGNYTLAITAIDGDNTRSNELTATFEVK